MRANFLLRKFPNDLRRSNRNKRGWIPLSRERDTLRAQKGRRMARFKKKEKNLIFHIFAKHVPHGGLPVEEASLITYDTIPP